MPRKKIEQVNRNAKRKSPGSIKPNDNANPHTENNSSATTNKFQARTRSRTIIPQTVSANDQGGRHTRTRSLPDEPLTKLHKGQISPTENVRRVMRSARNSLHKENKSVKSAVNLSVYESSEANVNNSKVKLIEKVNSGSNMNPKRLHRKKPSVRPCAKRRKVCQFDPNLMDDACDSPEENVLHTERNLEESSSPLDNDKAHHMQFPACVQKSDINPNGDPDICANISSSSSDPDELPDVFVSSPTKGMLFKKGDIVWVNYKKQPFWPAAIQKRYGAKRKLTIKFIEYHEFMENERGFPMVFSKERILPYPGDKYEDLVKEGMSYGEKSFQKKFNNAVTKADAYIRKRALNKVVSEGMGYFSSQERNTSSSDIDLDEYVKNISESRVLEDENDESLVEADSTLETNVKELSQKGQKSVERRDAVNEKLVTCVNSDKMREFLLKILRETKISERHSIFIKDSKEREKLKHGNAFGPIVNNDLQMDQIKDTLKMWYCTEKPKASAHDATSYVMDVWIPEAITEALRITKRCSHEKAKKLFEKGPRILKEEHKRNHELLLAQARNISPEDAAVYDEKNKWILEDQGLL